MLFEIYPFLFNLVVLISSLMFSGKERFPMALELDIWWLLYDAERGPPWHMQIPYQLNNNPSSSPVHLSAEF